MNIGDAWRALEHLASQGLFRSRELEAWGLSRAWVDVGLSFNTIVHRGYGIWSHPQYQPTRYELLQLRAERAVFWGPSALWLLGLLPREPQLLWLAIDVRAHAPRHRDDTTVLIRTRHLEAQLDVVPPAKTVLPLRVHQRDRALADITRRLRRKALAPRERSGLNDALRLSLVAAGR